MWRATLADGRVVDHDGENSPQQFLDLIVRFQVFAPNGAPLAEVTPGPNERVIWRWVRTNNGRDRHTVGVKFGLLRRDTGETHVRYFDGREWTPTTDFVLTPGELA